MKRVMFQYEAGSMPTLEMAVDWPRRTNLECVPHRFALFDLAELAEVLLQSGLAFYGPPTERWLDPMSYPTTVFLVDLKSRRRVSAGIRCGDSYMSWRSVFSSSPFVSARHNADEETAFLLHAMKGVQFWYWFHPEPVEKTRIPPLPPFRSVRELKMKLALQGRFQ